MRKYLFALIVALAACDTSPTGCQNEVSEPWLRLPPAPDFSGIDLAQPDGGEDLLPPAEDLNETDQGE